MVDFLHESLLTDEENHILILGTKYGICNKDCRDFCRYINKSFHQCHLLFKTILQLNIKMAINNNGCTLSLFG